MPGGVLLGDDTLTFHSGASHPQVRHFEEAEPVNCSSEKLRELAQAQAELDRDASSSLPHAAEAALSH
jgi:hypothetical protein